jgi:hypothetical protein
MTTKRWMRRLIAVLACSVAGTVFAQLGWHQTPGAGTDIGVARAA